MLNQFINDINKLIVPSVDEVKKQADRERVLFSENCEFTDDFIKLSYSYKHLFGKFLIEQTGLDRLDGRINELKIQPCPEEEMDFYQKYDSLGLKYFYIRGFARIDRLSEDELDLMKTSLEDSSEKSWFEIMSLINKTFKSVMTVNPENPETVYEPKRTILREYVISGGSIPLALRSVPEFNSEGNYLSKKAEDKRLSVFKNIAAKLDSSISKDLGCSVKTAIIV